MPKAEDFLKQYMPPESGAGLAARPSAEAFLADYMKPEEQREIAAGKRRSDQRDAAKQQRQADEELAMLGAGAHPSSLIDPETARTGLEILGTVGLGFLAPQAAIPAGMARGTALGLKGANLLSRILTAGTGAGASSLATEPLAPSPPGEAVPSALTKAGYAAAGQAGGEVLGPVLGKMLSPFAKGVTPGGAEAIATLAPAGARPTPGQATGSRTLDILENISEGSLFGGGFIRKAKEKAGTAAQKFLLNFTRSQPERHSELISGLYDDLTRVAGNELVDMTTTKAAAEAIRGQATRLSPEVKRVALSVLDAPDAVKFSVAQRLRSDLLSVSRKILSEMKPGAAKGAATTLAGSLDEAMEGSLARLGPEAVDAFRSANVAYREAIAGDMMRRMVAKATDPKTATISGDKLLRGLHNLAEEGKAVFTPDQMREFTKFSRVLSTIQSKSPETIGRVGIQLVQFGALAGLATGTLKEESSVALVLPAIIGLAMTNPTTARLLTTGFSRAGTAHGTAALGRLVGMLAAQQATREKSGEEMLYETLGVTP